MSCCLAYMTFKSRGEARSVAYELLKKKLIACFNLFPGTESFFVWEGKFSETKEFIGLAKLPEKNFEKVVQKVCELHSYENPCVIKVPVTGGSKEFLKWVESEAVV